MVASFGPTVVGESGWFQTSAIPVHSWLVVPPATWASCASSIGVCASPSFVYTTSDDRFNDIIGTTTSVAFEPYFRLGGSWGVATEVLLAAGYTPSAYAVSGHEFKGPQNARERLNYLNAMPTVLAHYQTLGTLDYVQIWGEWPQRQMWDSPLSFPDFFADALFRLNGSYPSLHIGGPGLVPKAVADVRTCSTSGDAITLLATLHGRWLGAPAAQRARYIPDFISIHVYSSDPHSYRDSVLALRDLLDGAAGTRSGCDYAFVPWAARGIFAGTGIVVDEYGPDETQRNAYFNYEEGAAAMTAAWIAMQHDGLVSRGVYYRGTELGPTTVVPKDLTSSSMGGRGLFYADIDKTRKVLANAFALWSDLYDEFPQMLPLHTGTEQPSIDANGLGVELWQMAGRSSDGRRAVLVANPNDFEVAYAPYIDEAWKTVAHCDHKIATVTEVTDAGVSTTDISGDCAPIYIPAHGVHLVRLTPW